MRNSMGIRLYSSLFALMACLCNSIILQGQQSYTRSGKDHALFFAAKDYRSTFNDDTQGWLDLKNPIRDALKLAQVLINKYGFNCQIFPDPSQEAIRLKIREYWEKDFSPDEQLLIYFSGHGEFEPFPWDKDKNKGKGYFIPADGKPKAKDITRSSYISYKELLEDIDAIPCDHILLILDACKSGAALDKSDNRPGALPDAEQLFRDVMPYRTRRIITSGGKERTSDGEYHSPLTEGLLEGLASNGGSNSVLSFHELYAFTLKQGIWPRPRAGSFGRNNPNSDFLFLHRSSKKRETITDTYGNKYPVIYLAGKQWLGENLKLKVPDSYCCHDDPSICRHYGRLYTTQAAAAACRKLGPGWRLPSDVEWKNLLISFGGYYDTFDNKIIGDYAQSYMNLTNEGAIYFVNPGYAADESHSLEDGIHWCLLQHFWSSTKSPFIYEPPLEEEFFTYFFIPKYRFSPGHSERRLSFEDETLFCRCIKD